MITQWICIDPTEWQKSHFKGITCTYMYATKHMSVGHSDGTKEHVQEEILFFPCEHGQEINHRLSNHNPIRWNRHHRHWTILPDSFFRWRRLQATATLPSEKRRCGDLKWITTTSYNLQEGGLGLWNNPPFLAFWDWRDMMIHPDLRAFIMITLQFWIYNKYVSYHVCWRSWISMCIQHRFGSCSKPWNLQMDDSKTVTNNGSRGSQTDPVYFELYWVYRHLVNSCWVGRSSNPTR